MKKDDTVFLRDILDAINYIRGYLVGITYEQFLRNKMMQDAVMRQLAIIGEAARNISTDLRQANPQVKWERITGMRNRLIHAYSFVDLDIVWEIAQSDVLVLQGEIVRMLKGAVS